MHECGKTRGRRHRPCFAGRLLAQVSIALYVNFDFNKATLKPDAQPVIAQLVELLKRNPGLKVSIEGHTDNIGLHDYNVKLSQDRAAAVVAAIKAAGIDGSLLSSAGFGPDKPVASNDQEDGRAKNRRVELVKAPLHRAPFWRWPEIVNDPPMSAVSRISKRGTPFGQPRRQKNNWNVFRLLAGERRSSLVTRKIERQLGPAGQFRGDSGQSSAAIS